jgi:dienelactone hydrolase
MGYRFILVVAGLWIGAVGAFAQTTRPAAAQQPFAFSFKKLAPMAGLETWEARMPSAIHTPFASNNTITVCGFEPAKASRAAAIVLPIANGKNLMLEKGIAWYLASQGIVAVVMPMPYQFDRGKDARSANAMDMADEKKGLALFIQGSEQAVSDVQRVRQWLVSHRGIDADKVGLVGISLGSLIASVTYSTDNRFSAAVLVLCGGDLADVVWHGSRETRGLKKTIIGMGHGLEWARRILQPMDPLTYATPARGKGVLMVNAKDDEVFPRASTMKLAHAYGDPELIMLPGNHYSVAVFLPAILERTGKFLRGHLLHGAASRPAAAAEPAAEGGSN